MGMAASWQSPPLSIYIHLPWCIRRCPYCDFNVHATAHKPFPEAQYVEALLRDLDYALPAIADRQITSIFLGGGTPSLFSGRAIARLLAALKSSLAFAPEIEISLEANPGMADSARFVDYAEAGVNRLSIGVQSFNDEKLRALGRIHNGRAARHAVRTALAAGLANVNVDLMYALPTQSVAAALDDIRQLIDAGVPHISWYQLTIEPNTLFHSRPPVLPDEELAWQIQEQGQQCLAAAGYEAYAISTYARQDKDKCAHNINYWRFGDYLGLGAGAHSKISEAQGAIRREARHRLPQAYMNKAGSGAVIVDERQLAEHDIVFEFMLNALRLTQGFTTSLFAQRTGMNISSIEPQLAHAEERGLLQREGARIRPTRTGSNYLNDLLQPFMPYNKPPTGIKRN